MISTALVAEYCPLQRNDRLTVISYINVKTDACFECAFRPIYILHYYVTVQAYNRWNQTNSLILRLCELIGTLATIISITAAFTKYIYIQLFDECSKTLYILHNYTKEWNPLEIFWLVLLAPTCYQQLQTRIAACQD